MSKSNIKLHILNASGKLSPYIKEIQNIFDEAVVKITNNIPVSNVDIAIVDNPFSTIPEIGIGGHAMTANYVVISLDHEFNNFKKTLESELTDTLAHELSHAVRWQKIEYPYNNLLEALITEGLADHFANQITKREDLHLWDKVLTSGQVSKLLKKAKEEYFNKNYNHYEWFFGSKEKGIPRWTGYTLGYSLVAEYLKKNPDKKPSQLYSLKAEDFIK